MQLQQGHRRPPNNFFSLLSLKQSDLIWKTARDEITITFSFRRMRAYGLLSGSRSLPPRASHVFSLFLLQAKEKKRKYDLSPSSDFKSHSQVKRTHFAPDLPLPGQRGSRTALTQRWRKSCTNTASSSLACSCTASSQSCSQAARQFLDFYFSPSWAVPSLNFSAFWVL